MKKSLIALASLAAVGAASAQSSVTVYGIADARLAVGNGSLSSNTALRNTGRTGSQLGFRGTEDLGGGMKAGFTMEGTANTDDGTGATTSVNNQANGAFVPATGANAPVLAGSQGFTFGRRMFVSLGGGFGELKLGRDYTPQFLNQAFYDPYGASGMATTLTLVGGLGPLGGGQTIVRASNQILYSTPSFGGFGVLLTTYFGENASNVANSSAGSGSAIRLSYDAGAISAGLSFANTSTGPGTEVVSTSLGGAYNFGVARLMAYVTKDANTGVAERNGTLVGVTAPFGLSTLRASLSSTEAAGARLQMFAIGFDYGLSKRTSIYTTLASNTGSGGATPTLNGSGGGPNTTATGFDIGIRHAF